jgi:hypothetical protein
MRTLDTHLVGVTADAAHPASYRPDLPLNNDPNPQFTAGYEMGYVVGERVGIADERRRMGRIAA